MKVILIGITLLLIQVNQVMVTTYGIDDQFTGQRHAASWHQVTPAGAPEIVDYKYPGAASNDYPLGTILDVTIEKECNGEPLPNQFTTRVIVLDRLDLAYTGIVDVWPAPAQELGLGIQGCAIGEVKIVKENQDER